MEHWFFSGKGTRHLSQKTPQRNIKGKLVNEPDEETDLSEEDFVDIDSSSEEASSDTLLG